MGPETTVSSQGLSDGGAGVVAVNALGPEVDRGGSALTHDTGAGEGIEKAWTASQRHPLACVEMCLVLPSTQGIEHSPSASGPWSHSCIYMRASTPVAQRPAPATFTRG